MEIEQLGEFYLLAETSSFSEAAEQLFIAQSTLSRHLKSLEEELGTPLFSRTKRKVEINEYGKLLLPYARQIVRLHCEMKNAIDMRLKTEKKLLSIGTISAIPQYGISTILATFARKHPDITLEIIEDESDVLEGMVRNGKLDFAFVNSRCKASIGLSELPLVHDTLTIMVAENHPFAKQDSVTLDQLCEESFLMLPDNTFLMGTCLDICGKAGFSPRISFHSIRGDNIADMVSKGLGISVFPKKAATYRPPEGVRFLDITPQVDIFVNIISQEPSSPAPVFRAFREYLCEYISNG